MSINEFGSGINYDTPFKDAKALLPKVYFNIVELKKRLIEDPTIKVTIKYPEFGIGVAVWLIGKKGNKRADELLIRSYKLQGEEMFHIGYYHFGQYKTENGEHMDTQSDAINTRLKRKVYGFFRFHWLKLLGKI